MEIACLDPTTKRTERMGKCFFCFTHSQQLTGKLFFNFFNFGEFVSSRFVLPLML